MPIARPDLEELRRDVARRHRRHARRRPPTSAPASRRRTKATTPRISRSIDRDGNAVSNTYTLNFSYGARPGRRRHRRAAQQRARRFHRQARRAERLRPGRLRRQSAGPGQAAAVVDDADHRAQGRQAVAGHRLARRQPHHHRGAAGDRQRDRLPHADRARGDRAAPASSMAAGRRSSSSRASIPIVLDALRARGHKIVPTAPHTSANSIAVIRRPSHAARLCRRRRPPHPRRAGGGILALTRNRRSR